MARKRCAFRAVSLLALLGVQPGLGRAFLPAEEEPGARVVILSHALWQRRFGGDPSVLGRMVSLNGENYQMIGVMPATFQFPIQRDPVELWTTVAFYRTSGKREDDITAQRENHFLNAIARLKPGVEIEQAQANLDTIAAALAKSYPDSNSYAGVRVVPLLRDIVGNVRPALFIVLGAAACVLLVACLNVANLLVARSLARQREISIRAALGASRGHIIRQLVTESLLLAIFGGAAGLLLAIWGVDSLSLLLPANLPRAGQIAPDARVLLFAIAITLLIGCVSGLAPAWRASQLDLVNALHEAPSRGLTEGRRGSRLRKALVVLEIVLALVLLAGAGLLVESFSRLQQVKPGFNQENVLTARVSLPAARYPKTQHAIDFYQNLLSRVSTLPGVRAASAAWLLPLSGNNIAFNFQIEERPLPQAQRPVAEITVVALDYFHAMQIPLIKGRDFTIRDNDKARSVAIVNESFARQFFPGDNPIGKHITPAGRPDPGEIPVREIIGIVGDIRAARLDEKAAPTIYLPHAQFGVGNLTLIVRSENNPESLIPALGQAVHAIDKDVPLYNPRALANYVSSSVAQPRFNALLVGLFAAIALLLSAAGIYGVMSYIVTQRTQEIGIRLALGAQRSDVLRLVISQGMQLVALGVGLGLLATLASTRLLRSLLYGIGTTHLPTFLAVAILLAVVALIACWLPAHRASHVDPIVALREG